MFSQNEKEWILEAINHLKRRKARPDFSRISLRMKRKHQLTITQTRQLLDSLVESGIVVKAVYKNNTSYRDVSKWKKGKLGGQILNSSRMLQRFMKAITSLTSDRKSTGVSVAEIEEWLSHNNEDKCFLSGAALRDAIENEFINGYLDKVEINNDTLYSVNTEKILGARRKTKDKGPECSDSDNKPHDIINRVEDGSFSTEGDFNTIKTAIYQTDKTGNGSTIEDMEKWMKENVSSFGCFSDKDNINRHYILKFLEYLVKSGLVEEKSEGNVTLFSVKSETIDVTNPFSSALSSDYTSEVKDENERGPDDKQGYFKYNLPPLLEMPPKQGNKAILSLRPPSKRKRILKSHGPDFEMELPTKSKARITSSGAPKEYSFPTPLDSPVSEKSETTIEQSFNFDLKKKRGRPKKMLSQENDQNSHIEDAAEEDKNGRFSEQSSVCHDDDDNEDIISELTLLPDVRSWTAHQVADYFFDQGYEEESKQMLENELDGIALGLLRRSDIVGPPTGGMLKMKTLGVALKLFRDIRNLLYQGNADNYIDPYEERPFFRS